MGNVTAAGQVNARRLRRLTQLDGSKAVAEASKALRTVWTTGRKPDSVVFRIRMVQLPADAPERAPLVRLVLPRGIALRFYLLAVFEAQCRLGAGQTWVSDRPLDGAGSWSEFIAIDGAYDNKSKTYMPDTKQRRTTNQLSLRQIKSALDTLERLGPEHALVTVPRAKNGGRRLYGEFSLMKETGKNNDQNPDVYTVPRNHRSSIETITVPADFFLKGWIQVLSPSEIATWLILQAHSQWARDEHAKAGVYLYGKAREEDFGLRRDAWEDGCQRLCEFGLIRHARPGSLDEVLKRPGHEQLVRFSAKEDRERYEPYRWQVTDGGLAKNAVKTCLKELTLRQKSFDAKQRTSE